MIKQLLIIGFVWPEPQSSAAGSRMMQIIEIFKSKNYKITFATACTKSDNAFDLKQIDVETKTIVLNDSSFDTFIKELNPEVVLFDRFMIEEQFGWRVAEQCPNALRILDTEDLHCLRRGRHQALKDNAFFDANYLFNDTAKREIASIYRCDLSIIISEVEIRILKEQFHVSPDLLIYLPFLLNSITLRSQRALPNFKERNHFITVGNFLHQPNMDGLLHLKRNIWPIIRKKLPKAQIHIYGAYVTEQAKQLNNEADGFLIKGFVEDINLLMQQYKVCLVPLRYGAGLKGKIIDAMLNGVPCVTSSIGAEGMYGNLEPNGFVEDDTKDFTEKAVELYTNKIFWNGKQKLGVTIINVRFDKQLYTQDFLTKVKNTQNNLELMRLHNFTGSMLMHHTLQSTKFMSKWIEEKNKK
ncbi:MAG: glycosyltransferase family 4 protein [Lacinutrix sp.]|uniref:glycosyltransferase n=1 Tax=Lacinutrix sp. TaxID=1937692 RepID=UPI0030AA8BF9